MMFAFYICDTLGFLRLVLFIKNILTIIKFVVPLGLIIFIALDIYKGITNPDSKEIGRKVGIRILIAVLVFLIPTLVLGILKLFDFVAEPDYQASNCYTNATENCIETINSYLNCDSFSGSEKSDCQRYRSCNGYTLSSSCSLTTELNENNCSNLNEKGNQFYANGYKK